MHIELACFFKDLVIYRLSAKDDTTKKLTEPLGFVYTWMSSLSLSLMSVYEAEISTD